MTTPLTQLEYLAGTVEVLTQHLATALNELCTASDQIPPEMEGDSLSVALIKLKDQLSAMREERDLAIAHDRQPYPTAWAYEQACKALEDHKQQLLARDERIGALTWALERVVTHNTLVPNCCPVCPRVIEMAERALKEAT